MLLSESNFHWQVPAGAEAKAGGADCALGHLQQHGICSSKGDHQMWKPGRRNQRERLQMFQHSSGDGNKRSGLKEQGDPDEAMPLNEGGQGQQARPLSVSLPR